MQELLARYYLKTKKSDNHYSEVTDRDMESSKVQFLRRKLARFCQQPR